MRLSIKRKESVQARRDLIMQTAALCFIEQGFHQTSIRDIANRAGISLGNLYNHFEGKNALIAEIASLEAADIEKLEKKVGKIAEPEKALQMFVSLYLDYCSRKENVALSAEILAEAVRNPAIAEGFLKNRARLIDYVATLMTGLGADNNGQADFVLDVIEGLATRSGFENRKPSKKETALLQDVVLRIVQRPLA